MTKMHENEFHIDESLVQRLLAKQFPHWANLPLKSVPSAGTDNALYRLGNEMVVRLPRIGWAVDNANGCQSLPPSCQFLSQLHLAKAFPRKTIHGPGQFTDGLKVIIRL